MELRSSPFPPGAPPDGTELAVMAWNIMGGLDWAALPFVMAMVGVDEDADIAISQLVAIRNAAHAAR